MKKNIKYVRPYKITEYVLEILRGQTTCNKYEKIEFARNRRHVLIHTWGPEKQIYYKKNNIIVTFKSQNKSKLIPFKVCRTFIITPLEV